MEALLARAAREIAAQWHAGELAWAAVGMAAQAAFFLRFLVQWIASERVKKSMVPRSFWYASLGGGLLLMMYAVHRRDVVFTLSQAAGVLIYLRNIHLIHRKAGRFLGLAAAVLGTAVVLFAIAASAPALVRTDSGELASRFEARTWGTVSTAWIIFGMAGSAVFFMRFVIQWVASERRKESVMPLSFWYVSIAGGLMLFIYVVHVRDLVLTIGQGVGMLVYLRNIVLSQGERGKNAAFVVVLALLSGLLFISGIDSTPLWASSEARTAQIAREMYSTGDYIVPHLNGTVALTKPPLYHWLAALSYRAFGVGEFGARFPSAVAALLTVLVTYFLARRMLGTTAGFFAAVMTATGMEFVWNARAARTDMVYTLFTVAAIAAFVYAAESRKHRRSLFALSFACMGLAFMTKGPAGVFLPVVSGIGYLYLAGRKAEIRGLPWVLGALIFLMITVPWHAAIVLSAGARELRYYFWGQLARWSMGQGAAKSIGDMVLSFLIYVPLLVKGFFPWSFFLPAGVWAAVKSLRAKREPFLALPLVWFVAGVAAFSLSGTRAGRYMLPLLPAGGIIVAYLWREACVERDGARAPGLPDGLRPLKASLWPVVVTGFLASIVIARALTVFGALRDAGLLAGLNSMDTYMAGLWASFLGAHPWAFGTGAVVFCLACAGALVAAYRVKVCRAFGLLAVVVTGYASIFIFALMPQIALAHNIKPFAQRIAELAKGAPCGWVGNVSLETLFYLGRPFDVVRPENVKQYLEDNPTAIVLVWQKDLQRLSPETLGYARELKRSAVKHRVVVIFASPWRPPEPAASDAPSG